ncbi:arylsulfatase [Xylariaceae sp. FL1651]|nr:arylsulfatase [Xylariaceae sp. FL1651]
MARWRSLFRGKPAVFGCALTVIAIIMIPLVVVLTHFALVGMGGAAAAKPNIVFIMTDDQDRRLGSMDYMPILQQELVAKGTEFTNHYTNQALCCPSRSTLLRGQTVQVHTINGFFLDRIRTTCLTGFTMPATEPNVEPYIDDFNLPVLSQNGERPIFYKGFHQTDIIRTKALDRLNNLTSQSAPFFLAIAPFTPHVGYQQDKPSHRTIPLQRHLELFPDAKAPKTPNYNPPDEYQANAGGWVKNLVPMNSSAINFTDFVYRSRIQALAGIDEIIADVVGMLESKGIINNTYIVFTSDNGYHLGQHRMPGGKSLFYNEDTNLPFVVRGPGVPANVTSDIPSLHIDLAPTFLDIAGVPEANRPVFFDGRSVLPQWHDPKSVSAAGAAAGQSNSKESINIEYWGRAGIEAPSAAQLGSPFANTTYKTIRLLGAQQSWVYTVWCSGERELYNTAADPYELVNLAHKANSTQLVNRLNALLMVTKSCEQNSCRDPWSLLQPTTTSGGQTRLVSLTQAMDTAYDAFFADFEKVAFETCLLVQSEANEMPYFPPLEQLAGRGLGRAYRNATDVIKPAGGVRTISTPDYYGTAAQRHVTLADITAASRVLTDAELAAR